MFGIEQNVDLLILTLPLGTLPLIQISNTSCLHYVNKDKLELIRVHSQNICPKYLEISNGSCM